MTGEQLQKIRLALGLSLENLGVLLSYNKAQIWRFEKGEQKIRKDERIRILSILHPILKNKASICEKYYLEILDSMAEGRKLNL
jgi:transcriptional regulator with XRE-family HTH domain